MKNFFLALAVMFSCAFAKAQDATASTGIQLNGDQLFGDLRARQIGPALMSGRINDMEVHPTDSRTIYAGAAGGGVWRSKDGGATFSPIFDKHTQSIGTVTLDPNAPDSRIWVGTGETWTRNSVSYGDGIYLSTDGGNNWKNKGLEETERISAIEVHPSNSDVVYVAALGKLWSNSDQRGIFKTTDGGETWDRIFYINERTGAGDLVVDPTNPDIMYASMWEHRRTPWDFTSGGPSSGLYKTTDGGKNWNKIHTNFPAGDLGRIAVAVAPSDASILYAVLETEQKDKNGLWKSTNAGASWEHLNNDFGLTVRPFYFSRIVIDPRNPDVIVKGGLSGSISRDGGKTFKDMGNMHSDIHDIAFSIKDSDIMYVGTDGGVYRTWDGANTMEIVESLPLSQFYHISVDNDEPYNVYGGLQDNGSWYGPNTTVTGGVQGRDWNSVGYGDGFRVLRHHTKPIVYSEMQGAENVWRYDMERKRTRTIQPTQPEGKAKLRFNWNAPITLSPSTPDRIYIGSQFLHVSDDMGNSWKIISPDLTTNDPKKQPKDSGGLSTDKSGAENHTTIFTIAESPVDEKTIWVGTDDGNIQITTNFGKKWKNVTKNLNKVAPKNTWVYHIEASEHNAGTAYAILDGHATGNMKPYVMKTTDFGNSWTNIATDDIYGVARNIQEDYVNPNLLFVGTEMGLYITVDGGANWSKFENNMPPVAVHYIDLQRKTNDLVMGTHGRGVIILDDISILREIKPDILDKDVHFFATKPGEMIESAGFTGNFGGETQFVGQGRNTNMQIAYYLKKRHTFGKMDMVVQDMDGNVVAKLGPGKKQGINVVNWSYNMNVPKIAAGKVPTFAGFTSPRVPAGDYKVVLTKGKETYEHPVTVSYDSSSLLTMQDREEHHALTMELYDMTEDLAYLVYLIDQDKKNIKKVLKKSPSNASDLEKMNQKLVDLHATLVVTTGDNYVSAADPELREKLATLYSTVASNVEKPSPGYYETRNTLKKRYEQAVKDYDAITKKYRKDLMSALEATATKPSKTKDKETFLSK